MGIDAKDIQVFVLRIVKVCVKFCFRFVLKHPVGSTLSLLLFVIYLFLRTVFLLLIYSFPFIACVAVYIRFYLPSQCPKFQNDSRAEKTSPDLPSAISRPRETDRIVRRNGASFAKCRTLSRRTFKAKNIELDSQTKEEDQVISKPGATDQIVRTNDASVTQSETILQRNVKEKNKELDAQTKEEDNMVFSTNPDVDSAAGETVLSGEKLRGFNESSSANVGAFNETSECRAEGGGGEAELESSSSEEGEEAQKVTNRALEWTEEDQKNLMDLGISEMERNKRLESLIARRRARKLCKMHTEKILNHNNAVQFPVPPVLVGRGNPFNPLNDPDEKIPGSAPSILPSRNPFDLPYDPCEEKPDLMGDSFQQEFKAVYQKEIFFCRHESFTWGTYSSLESKQKAPDFAGFSISRKEQDKGANDGQVNQSLHKDDKTLRRSLSITDLVTEEGESSNQVEENQPEEDEEPDTTIEIADKQAENTNGSDLSIDKGNGILTETHRVEHKRSESSLSSISDDNEQITTARKTAVPPNIEPPVFRFPDMTNSPSSNSDPCPIPKARGVIDTSYLASPATINRSSLDNHLLYTNNGLWHTPTNSIASDMQVEVSETGSPPLRGDGSASCSDGESLTCDDDLEKEVATGSDEIWGVSPHPAEKELEMTSREVNEFSEEVNTGDVSGFYKEPDAPIASSSGPAKKPQDSKSVENISDKKISSEEEKHAGNSKKPREISCPSEKTADLAEFRNSVIVQDHGKDLEGPKSVEIRQVEAEDSIKSEEVGDRSKPGMEVKSKSLNNPMQSAEAVGMAYGTNNPVAQANVTNEDMKSSENRVDRIDRNIEKEVLDDLSKRAKEIISESGKNPESNADKPPANSSILQPTQDSWQEQSAREFEVSGINQSSNNLSTSGKQPEMAVEQPSTISTTSASLMSVLPDMIPSVETTSDLNVQKQLDDSRFDTEDKRDRDKLLDETLHNNLVLTSNQNPQHVTEDPINQSSTNMPEKSKETSESADKATEITSLNEPMLVKAATEEDIKSLLTMDGGLEPSISNKASEKLSEPHEEINSPSVEQVNDTSRNLTEYATKNGQSKPGTVTEQESRNPSQEFTQKADGNPGTKDLTERRTDIILTNPAVEGVHVDMPVKVEAQDLIAAKDEATNDTTSNDGTQLVGNGERETKRLDKHLNTLEGSNVIEDSTSGSLKVVETGPRNLIDDVVNNIEDSTAGSLKVIETVPRNLIDDAINSIQDSTSGSLQATETGPRNLTHGGVNNAQDSTAGSLKVTETRPTNLTDDAVNNIQDLGSLKEVIKTEPRNLTDDAVNNIQDSISGSSKDIVETEPRNLIDETVNNIQDSISGSSKVVETGLRKLTDEAVNNIQDSTSGSSKAVENEPINLIDDAVNNIQDSIGGSSKVVETGPRNLTDDAINNIQDSTSGSSKVVETGPRNLTDDSVNNIQDSTSGSPKVFETGSKNLIDHALNNIQDPTSGSSKVIEIRPRNLTDDAVDNIQYPTSGSLNFTENGPKHLTDDTVKSVEDATSRSLKVRETAHENLTDDEVNNIQLQPPRESNSSNGLRNIDDVARQENNDGSKAVQDIDSHSRDQTQDGT